MKHDLTTFINRRRYLIHRYQLTLYVLDILFDLTGKFTSILIHYFFPVLQGKVPKCCPELKADIMWVCYTKCPDVKYETIIGWGLSTEKLCQNFFSSYGKEPVMKSCSASYFSNKHTFLDSDFNADHEYLVIFSIWQRLHEEKW